MTLSNGAQLLGRCRPGYPVVVLGLLLAAIDSSFAANVIAQHPEIAAELRQRRAEIKAAPPSQVSAPARSLPVGRPPGKTG